ncbi:hypothetical protein [Halorussus halobius]|uniref:hypothetical protein n=1 Tax=Halorussus halobius TaxID=1710537 RepID=UPI001091B430|nr:hypothetical protein [Halorussus halobius]
MDSDKSSSRRNILKGVATGSLAAVGLPGLASAVEDVDPEDVGSLMKSEQVRAIERADPKLKLQLNEAKALGSSDFAVMVPTNHGRLVVVDHDGGREAVLQFDQRVSAVDADWPEGTTGKLKATGDEAVFQRTATSEESRQALEQLGETDLVGSDDVVVSLTPETGEHYVTRVDADAKEMETITARDTGSSGMDLSVAERDVRSHGDDVSTAGCDCDDEAADLIYCVYQAGSCLSCFVGSPVPPVLAACIVFVCAGGTGGVPLTFVADLGCTDVDPSCVQNCAESAWEGLV